MIESTKIPSFEEAQILMRDLGFEVLDARSTPQAFGSWFVRGTASGKDFRVVWDGRDGALAIQAPSLSGRPEDWGDRWIAGEAYSQKPDQLRSGLLALLGS